MFFQNIQDKKIYCLPTVVLKLRRYLGTRTILDI